MDGSDFKCREQAFQYAKLSFYYEFMGKKIAEDGKLSDSVLMAKYSSPHR